ncbi:MAG TPA: phosphopyruvate hydratase [Thermoplasmatales archaeon]|nr:phosphopyruvate hydratase [Thermoplasmatales archaeon]
MISLFKIERIYARQILDSRGNPTLEVEVETKLSKGVFSVPSGASTGSHEALELRDGNKEYKGRSVKKAVNNVINKIAPSLIGLDVREQKDIDEIMIELDGTPNKSVLGANAILGCSVACAKAAAASLKIPVYEYIGKLCDRKPSALPVPFMNVINGGKHAGNNLDIQEHMIVPSGAESFSEGLRACVEVYFRLGEILKEKYGKSAVNVGDEGGYAPPLNDPEEPFKLIKKAIEDLNYGDIIKLGLDAAASEFYKDQRYTVGDSSYDVDGLVNFYERLVNEYDIISVEDPFAEDDWDGFKEITKRLGKKIQIVGDDLFVTNRGRIKKGINLGVCNCLLLKINQIGTLTEALEAANLAFENGYNVMVSHRSGETCDPFIADLAVGINCGQIKTGAPCRGERVVKYNRLLKIEEEMKNWKYSLPFKF